MSQVNVPQMVTAFSADLASLNRKFPGEQSESRLRAHAAIYYYWRTQTEGISGDELSTEDWNDLVLLENTIKKEESRSHRRSARIKAGLNLIPGATIAVELLDHFRELDFIAVEESARMISDWSRALTQASNHNWSTAPKADISMALSLLNSIFRELEAWHDFFSTYDPTFDWWIAKPYSELLVGLNRLKMQLRAEGLGIQEGDDEAIVGDPIGLEGLKSELAIEFIAFEPKDLIAMAEKEREWCHQELHRAAKELGLTNGMAAINHVKRLHEPPGNQPQLVRDLANEAIGFVENNGLLTVPELAKQTWRMSMMPADKQKVNPFFLGGEQIIVSFPTSTMDHEFKLMSLRGNNRHFARATVHHELIPGHHIQQFMNARNKTHRKAFWTPFWVEGWTLHWEMVLWDQGFARGPEDRVGMLFWRLHRALRVIFSLKFHLGEMSAAECIELLVEEGGHERSNAEGEVRRSFSGAYPELYQAAYLIGGIQVRALARELAAKGWPLKTFLDRMISENQMPIEAVRALILNERLPRPSRPNWKFSG